MTSQVAPTLCLVQSDLGRTKSNITELWASYMAWIYWSTISIKFVPFQGFGHGPPFLVNSDGHITNYIKSLKLHLIQLSTLVKFFLVLI